jgi:hypothetical protein
MSSSKTAFVIRNIEQKYERVVGTKNPISLKAVMDGVREAGAAAASDWVGELGEQVAIMYGWGKCNVYPTKSNAWWRCISWAHSDDRAGLTSEGGHWCCPNCCDKWEWGKYGHMQLLIVGDEKGYFMCYLGTSSSSVQNNINFIKRCKLVVTLDGVPVTREAILEAVKLINNRVDGRLLKFKECKRYTSRSPTEVADVKIYCEDDRLYMFQPGIEFAAIQVNPSDLTSVSGAQVEHIVDMCASFLNIDDDMKLEPAMKRARNELLASPTVQQTRSLLSEILKKKKKK